MYSYLWCRFGSFRFGTLPLWHLLFLGEVWVLLAAVALAVFGGGWVLGFFFSFFGGVGGAGYFPFIPINFGFWPIILHNGTKHHTIFFCKKLATLHFVFWPKEAKKA